MNIMSGRLKDKILQKINPIVLAIENSGGECRLVGGIVRDMILDDLYNINALIDIETDLSLIDIDLSSTLTPEENIKALQNIDKNINIIPIGIDFGTILVIYKHVKFEITTLRLDIDCDGRHTSVRYSKSWEVDASRRDFTINALYMDRYGKIYDYYGGVEDLNKMIVRFINKAEDRINEDYLRILRYFRFYTYLQSYIIKKKINTKNIDEESYNVVIKLSNNLTKLSKERIKNEMFKMMRMPEAYYTLVDMANNNILQYIFVHLNDCEFKSINFIQNEPLLNLAAFLISKESFNMENINSLRRYWGLSNYEYDILNKLYNLFFVHDFKRYICGDKLIQYLEIVNNEVKTNLKADLKIHNRFLYYISYETYINYIKTLFILYNKDISKKQNFNMLNLFLNNAKTFRDNVQIMPINGYDIENALGIVDVRMKKVDKKNIGYVLNCLKLKWVESDFTLLKEQLLCMIDTLAL